MEVSLNAERFFARLERLQTDWMTHKSGVWGGSDALCVPLGAVGDEINYSKSSAFHLFLFGYEFADSLIVITRNNFYFMATAKKCGMLEKDLVGKHDTIKVHLLVRSKDEGQNREHFNELGNVIRKGGGKKLGSLFKAEYEGNFIPSWMNFLDQSQLEKVDISPALGLLLAVKDEVELVRLTFRRALMHSFDLFCPQTGPMQARSGSEQQGDEARLCAGDGEHSGQRNQDLPRGSI